MAVGREAKRISQMCYTLLVMKALSCKGPVRGDVWPTVHGAETKHSVKVNCPVARKGEHAPKDGTLLSSLHRPPAPPR